MPRSMPSAWTAMLQRHRHRSPKAALAELRERGAFRLRGGGELLRVAGGDRLDLLHRLSASPLLQLRPGACATAIFTDDKGRLLDLAMVANEPEQLLLLSGEGRRQELQTWIERYTIMEDVRTLPLSSWVVDLLVPEPTPPELVEQLSARGYPAPGRLGGGGASGRHWLHPRGPVRGLSHILVDPSGLEPALETLHRAGLRPVDDAIWHAWAVRAGHALSSDVLSVGANPLELGLREWIGWSKGCYIGQEVIARLDTYDKVRRRRAIIESSGIGPGRGTALEIDGRKRGIALTSAKEPGEEDFVTLALLDRSIEVGATLRWEDEGAGTVAAIPAP